MNIYILRLVICFIILSSRSILAQISPGELSRVHQNLEGMGNCTQCHEVGNEINGSRCLSCHKDIQHGISSKRGFHFSNSNKQCISCHKEHIGRNAKITMFSENGFDHSLTGFPLTGKHSQLNPTCGNISISHCK